MEFGLSRCGCRVLIWNYFVVYVALTWLTGIKYVSAEDNSTLTFVIVLHHHGDRTPIATYPTDRYQQEFWPQGFGQLTQVGILRSYNLGQYLRQKYIETGFLSTTYLSKQIYVHSIDDDRCLMSAQSLLAGMYPPSDNQVWNSDINWQPIPVHTMPQHLDKLFYDFPCPLLEEADNEMKASETIQNLEDEYKDTLSLISNYTGYNLTSIFDEELRVMFDALNSERRYGLDLPDWASPELIHQIGSLLAKLDFYKYNTTLQKQLRGGLLVSEYISLIQNKISNDPLPDLELPKLLVFSADDHTLLNLLGSLGIYNNKSVPYSATVITEVYESGLEPEQYYISISYHNETKTKAHQLKMPGCVHQCPISDFIYLTKNIVVDNIDVACRSATVIIFGLRLDNLLTVVMITIILGLIVLFLLLLCITCCYSKRWRHRKVRRYGRIRAETVPEEVPMMNTVVNGSDLDD